jgi:hypothetical protein
MGLHHVEVVASAVGNVAAMVAVLAMGVLALLVVRRLRRDDEPLFPEFERERARNADPAAFTEQLAEAGTVADDVSRGGAVAGTSGFEQAYALLALVDGDPDVRTDAPAPAATAAPDPYAQLARIEEPAEDERALAAFADGTSGAMPADGDTPAAEAMAADRPAVNDSVDTLLPAARSRRLRARTA